MARVQDPIILYRDPRFYAAFPAVTVTGGGAPLVVFRRARDQRWLLPDTEQDPDLLSVDHVDARSELAALVLDAALAPAAPARGLPVDAMAGDQDASLLRLSDGRILLAGFQWYPLAARLAPVAREWRSGLTGSAEDTGCLFQFWGGYTRLSADDGASWTDHAPLPVLDGHRDLVPGRRPHHGGAVRGRPAQTADGAVLLACYAGNPEGRRLPQSHLILGDPAAPGGLGHRGVIAANDDPHNRAFLEPSLHLAPSGRLTAFHRTAGLDDHLATAVSTDLGASWSPPKVEEVVGHPFDPLPLADGRIFLAYGHRHEPFGIRARVYDPARESPGDGQEIILRADGLGPDLGYPWSVEVAPGRVLTVYYLSDSDGVRHIAGSVTEL